MSIYSQSMKIFEDQLEIYENQVKINENNQESLKINETLLLTHRKSLKIEAPAPVRERGAGQDRRIVAPVLERAAVAFEELASIAGR